MKLFIVESPSKQKIIQKYFPNLRVLATRGHVREIPHQKNMVLLFNDRVKVIWEDMLSMTKFKKEVIEILKENKIESVILATDMDREGERIASDIEEWFQLQNLPTYRIIFSAITKEKINHAIKNMGKVDYKLVSSAKARAALDYYFGWKISPILWSKITKARSMGRVQAPALNYIAEREIKNLNKKSQKIWYLKLYLDDVEFTASYDNILELLKDLRQKSFKVKLLCQKFKVKSYKPLNTLDIQKLLCPKLKLSAYSLMRHLQELYSGDRIEDLEQGLITYMRTDSRDLDISFVQKTKVYLKRKEFNGLDEVKINKLLNSKVKGPHEAIRPTQFFFPKQLNDKPELKSIFQHIVKYNLAIFFQPSQFNKSQLFIFNTKLKSKNLYEKINEGNHQIYKLVNYPEGKFQLLKKWEKFQIKINLKTNFKWDFLSESKLISELENKGIGKPSTWSGILPTLRKRGYVSKQGCHLEHLGFLVYLFISQNLKEFTVGQITNWMERKLDYIAQFSDPDQIELRKMLRYIDLRLLSIKSLDTQKSPLQVKCCEENMSLYFSMKKNVFVFFKCKICDRFKPFNYRDERKNFISRGKEVSLIIEPTTSSTIQ